MPISLKYNGFNNIMKMESVKYMYFKGDLLEVNDPSISIIFRQKTVDID